MDYKDDNIDLCKPVDIARDDLTSSKLETPLGTFNKINPVDAGEYYSAPTSGFRKQSRVTFRNDSIDHTATPQKGILGNIRRRKSSAPPVIYRITQGELPPELEEMLFKKTYFDRDELQILYKGFLKAAGQSNSISKEQFVQYFPAFSGSDKLVDSLFSAMDRNNDGAIQFSEFVVAISTMTRGTRQEKVKLAFEICDVNGDNHVSKQEVLEVANTASEIFTTLGFDGANFCTAPEVVDSIFSEENEIASEGGNLDEMSLKDFIKVAELDPDINRCFGMFDYFYYMAVKPIETALETDLVRPEMRGHLVKKRKVTFLGGLVSKVTRRFYVVKERFLIEYHHMRNKPRRVICLLNARVKQIDHEPSKFLRKNIRLHGFVLSVGSYERTFITPSPVVAREWVHTIRANAKGGYRYQSFAPVRQNVQSQFYINGKEYFEALAEAIPKANHEIFIAGWWVKPEVYLKRKYPLQERYRLDRMLKERAERGVQIKVLVWDETSLGVVLGSSHTKSHLEKLHKNIHVVKHPWAYPLTWSHHQKFVVIDQELAFVGGIDLCFMRYDDEHFSLLDFEGQKFPGKDYGNLNVTVKRTGDPMVDQIDRNVFPRLPWHDVVLSVKGLPAADVGFNFIQRWNHAVSTNSEYKSYPYLLPKPLLEVLQRPQTPIWEHLVQDFKNLLFSPPPTDELSTPVMTRRRKSRVAVTPHRPPKPIIKPENEDEATEKGTCEAQVVRSVADWSAGQDTEDSIYKAYMDQISKAEHFIYIQNLYFISSTGGNRPKNRVALAILRRLRRAIQNKELFRVIVLVSVYPAGEMEQPATRILIGWVMKAICRGGKSILELLQAEFPDVDLNEYISFYSLRNWDHSKGTLYTEMIYVHSKVLIVDDRVAIVGSANINDRSFRGTRDSEICLVVRDLQEITTTMGGQPFQAGEFAHNLRVRLWSLHTGASRKKLIDPIHPQTYHNVWRATAMNNTQIYSEVFGDALPENHRKVAPILRSIPLKSKEMLKKLRNIRGYLINYPMQLLIEEDLDPSVFHKEWFVKTIVFI